MISQENGLPLRIESTDNWVEHTAATQIRHLTFDNPLIHTDRPELTLR